MGLWDRLVGIWKRFMLEAPPSNDMMIKRLWVVVRTLVIEAAKERRSPAELASRIEHYTEGYPYEVRAELGRKAKELWDRLDAKSKSLQS